jgi:hypothetical protein
MEPGVKRWHLGGRSSVDGHHEPSYVLELSEEEVGDFRRRFRWFHDLAGQEGLARVVESGGRWRAILTAAMADIDRDEAISNLSQRAAEFELRAFVRLSDRALSEIMQQLDALTATLAEPADALRKQVARLRRTGPLATLVEVEREGQLSSPLLTRRGLDPFYVRGLEVYGAEELIAETVDRLRVMTVTYLLAAEAQFLLWASELKERMAAVSTGMPSLIAIVEGADGSPKTYEFTDFPVFAMDLSRTVYVNFHHGAHRQGIDLLLQGRYRRSVRFGEGEAAGAVFGGGSTDPLDGLATADFKIDSALLGSEPIDYWAPVVDRIEERGEGRDMFRGSVREAVPAGSIVELECEAGSTMLEQLRGGSLAANFEKGELVHALGARTDWEDELKLSEPLPERAPETFEVWVPVFGIDVIDEVELGEITILPGERGRERIAPLAGAAGDQPGRGMVEEYEHASCHALAHASATMPGEAEEIGLASIDTALSWLATRDRYGAALLPDGQPLEFHRDEALSQPRRGGVVFVIGQSTKRQWIRRPDGSGEIVQRSLSPSSQTLVPPLPSEVPRGLRLAFTSLSLAISADEPLIQVQAISLTLEAYASGRRNKRKLFSKGELAEVRALFEDQFTPDQQRRLDHMISILNEESHGHRLRRLVREDAVPVTEAEFQLLDDLRQARNDIVHGDEVETLPTREQVDHGIAIVARILVHRVAALSTK